MNDDTIDRAAIRRLLDLIGGNPDDLDELLADFRSAAPDLAERIGIAAADGDLDALRIASHTLKSNARDFGAVRLSELCEELERECLGGAVQDAQAKAVAIAEAEALARQVLSDIRANHFRQANGSA